MQPRLGPLNTIRGAVHELSRYIDPTYRRWPTTRTRWTPPPRITTRGARWINPTGPWHLQRLCAVCIAEMIVECVAATRHWGVTPSGGLTAASGDA